MQSDECQLCGMVQPDVEPAYLRVVGQSLRSGLVTSRQLTFRCQCCEACFNEAGRIKALRFKVLAWMLVWLFLCPCCLAPLGMALDAHGSRIVNALVLIPALCIAAGGFLAGPIFLRIATRRRTERLLGLEVNRLLRTRAGIRRWGLFTELVILRELPTAQTYEIL